MGEDFEAVEVAEATDVTVEEDNLGREINKENTDKINNIFEDFDKDMVFPNDEELSGTQEFYNNATGVGKDWETPKDEKHNSLGKLDF